MFADCRKHEKDSSLSNLFVYVWSAVLKHVFVLSVVGTGFGESGGAAPDACGISKEICLFPYSGVPADCTHEIHCESGVLQS
jgi:hypothetical protein